MAKYLYSGPHTGVPLRNKDDSVIDVALFPGSEVDLPEEADFTKTLIALKRLTPVKTQAKTGNNKVKENASGS